MTSERQLLEALRRRDQEAFTQLFQSHSDRIFRLAANMLGDDDQAEDVVQDTFSRFFENLDKFEGRSRIGTWLYRVAYNAAIDRLRRSRPNLTLDDNPDPDDASLPAPAAIADWSQAPEAVLDSIEAQAELDAAIAELPPSLRAAFILFDVEGLSGAETAEVLGTSAGAVRVRVHRARLLLRESLTEYFGERLQSTTGGS
jgi:RNA polymerase sigma-70 factor (ECF subfamily)